MGSVQSIYLNFMLQSMRLIHNIYKISSNSIPLSSAIPAIDGTSK